MRIISIRFYDLIPTNYYYCDAYSLTAFSALGVPILFNVLAIAEQMPTSLSWCSNCIRAGTASFDPIWPNASMERLRTNPSASCNNFIKAGTASLVPMMPNVLAVLPRIVISLS